MAKYTITAHLRGRYIQFDYDFELMGDNTVFSVFTEDPEMGQLVGSHFHLICRIDSLNDLQWAVHHLTPDETDLKGKIALAVKKHYLALSADRPTASK